MGIKLDKNPLPVEQNNYLASWARNPTNNFKVKTCFFGETNIVKNSDKEKYAYSGYRTTFYSACLWKCDFDFATDVFVMYQR